MGKKGKKGQAGKPKKLTPKDVGKRLNALAKKVEEELKDVDLFAPLPPTEDCAVCLVPLSRLVSNSVYFACCGNFICVGCVEENKALIKKQNEENGTKGKDTCPFCREPRPIPAEYVRQLEARALKSDQNALLSLGGHFMKGEHGLPQDELKALDCYIQAAELGCSGACTHIGDCHNNGKGAAINNEKSALFWRAGALGGDIVARNNIGCSEYNSGNLEIGIRHWKIAAEAGYQNSLDALKKVYNGKIPGKQFISKECMDSLYRVCHDAQEEVKTEEREKHGRVDDMYKC